MKSKMTMAQMAEELGVSRITVSAVINGREKRQRISPETAGRIREYLERRGYVQSKSALQMKAGDCPESVGILYCGGFMPFSHLDEALSRLTGEIERRSGIVDITGISLEQLRDGLRDQVSKGVTRLVWIHAGGGEIEMRNMELLRPLLERMERVVCYNALRNNEFSELPKNLGMVGFNRDNAYRRIGELWRERGHSRIALSELFYNAPGGLPGTARLGRSFAECGFEVYGLHPAACSGLDAHAAATAIADNLIRLNREKQVGCAFIRNEMQAALVLRQLLEHGIRVPEELAVTGFGDNPYLEMLPVPLTTFAVPVEEMCAKTIELLYSPEAETGGCYEFECRMMERRSHGKGL